MSAIHDEDTSVHDVEAEAAGATPPQALLADLPSALLHALVDRCWTSAGAVSIWQLSATCKTLQGACNSFLEGITHVTPAATVALRAAPPPRQHAAVQRSMQRLFASLRHVTCCDLSGLHFYVHDGALKVCAGGNWGFKQVSAWAERREQSQLNKLSKAHSPCLAHTHHPQRRSVRPAPNWRCCALITVKASPQRGWR